MALRNTMKGEKSSSGFMSKFLGLSPTAIIRIIIRVFQFVMGLTVIGLYAQDLDKARRAHKYIDSKWAYAVFCGSASSIASIVFLFPFKSWFFFIIDALIFLFYVVLFGIFGKMFLREDPEGNKGIIRMKHAAWVDMVNMILWALTASWGVWVFVKTRKARQTSVV
ncbi:hypothetical protein BCR34DRAFT_481774 [Clohesyomyces aquaticus]|uniref:MARVEL domain-containing protein n=1 Tax=Clohesyomyces aquaticus TaxID=1231657 RepID=A0A1Y1ZRY2_9PLEO|nr:hypothetical protein BCR34DRAFT_481774 [Clohesyomyces aquaticus]